MEPYEIFRRQLTAKGSFAQVNCMDRSLAMLRSGRVRTDVPTQEVVAQRARVHVDTVVKTSRAYAERGGEVEATVSRKKRLTPPVESKVTGEVEARLIALACSAPPEGQARWSLRLLEKHVVLTEGLPDLDHSTIGRVLKKTSFVLI